MYTLLYATSALLTYFIPLVLTIKALETESGDAKHSSVTPTKSYQFLLNYWIYYIASAHILHHYTENSFQIQLGVTAVRVWLFYGATNNLKTINQVLVDRVFTSMDMRQFEARWIDPFLRQYISTKSHMTVLQYYLNQLSEKTEAIEVISVKTISRPGKSRPSIIENVLSTVKVFMTASERASPAISVYTPRTSSPPSRAVSVKNQIKKSLSNKSLRSSAQSSAAPSGHTTAPRRRSHRSSDPPYPSKSFLDDIPMVEHAVADDVMDEIVHQPDLFGVYNDYFNNHYAREQREALLAQELKELQSQPARTSALDYDRREPSIRDSAYKIDPNFFVQNKHKLFPTREGKPLPTVP